MKTGDAESVETIEEIDLLPGDLLLSWWAEGQVTRSILEIVVEVNAFKIQVYSSIDTRTMEYDRRTRVFYKVVRLRT